MANALDMYRAQQTAAKEVHAKLSEVSALVQQVRREVDALAKNHDLRDLLRQEQTWLEQVERTVKEVQRWRDLEAYRFWPGRGLGVRRRPGLDEPRSGGGAGGTSRARRSS